MTANAFLEWYTGNPVILTGYNTALNTTFEFIGPLSLPWVESLTAGSQQHQFIPEDTLIVASASASDEASAGVGMRTMMLVGCDSRGKIISETISLNGNTSVATTKKYRLIYCAHGMTYGTTGCNVGIIYIGNKASTNTAGVLSIPAATLVINIGSVASAGQNMACNPCFMVPPGEKYRLSRIWAGATVSQPIVSIRVREAEVAQTQIGGWYDVERISVGSLGPDLYKTDIILDAGDIIRFDALATAAGSVSIKAYLDKIRPA
jgi:hypothetical protein